MSEKGVIIAQICAYVYLSVWATWAALPYIMAAVRY